MMLFDIGANRGDVVFAGTKKGFNKIIALEPAPRIYKELVSNFLYDPRVIPLKLAVSDSIDQTIEFYEADEDGLSTINKDWLTSETMPYNGKPYRTIRANTITIDKLVEIYGEPDLIKIDVEGAEWSVFKGMTKYHGMLSFEWTNETIKEHQDQLDYLKNIGYKEVGPQFIEHHLTEPKQWFAINDFSMLEWVKENSLSWVNSDWKISSLRPTADVGMCWVR